MSQFGKQFHLRSDRVLRGSGKRVKKARDKKRYEIGSYFTSTRLSQEEKRRVDRTRGGNEKIRLLYAKYANVITKNGYKKVAIKGVIESKDNRNFARLNIITKGSLIDTELGKAIVTSRPGQDGVINAKLV